MIISEMNVKLTASTSAFAKAMDRASGRVKKFRAGAGKLGGVLKVVGMVAVKAAAAVAGIAWGAKQIFDLGASIAETGSKFRTVFGPEASAEVSAFLDNFAAKAGLTTNEAKGLVATTGAIAQGLGFSQKASGAFAVEITKLAGDLSSFNNLPTEQVLLGINSALTGEREQMKQLGVVILEADVQAKAFAQTGKTVAKSLTQQEKATATLALITEKAGFAIGDLDRTSGSAANVAKRLGTVFRELRDAVANALMPAFKTILDSLTEHEQKFIDMKKAIIDNTMGISLWAVAFVESLKFLGQAIIQPLRMITNLVTATVHLYRLKAALSALDFKRIKEEMEGFRADAGDIKNSLDILGASAIDWGKAMGDAFAGTSEEMRKILEQMRGLTEGGDGDPEDGPLAPTIAAVKTLEDKLKDLTENFSKNFVNRMTTAAQGGQDAFKGYFAYMRKQLIALAMRALLFKAIMGVAGKFNLDLGGFAKSMTGFESATSGDSGDTGEGAGGAGTPLLSGHAARTPRGGMIVNQNINFSVSAIDGRDAARFIKEQGGTIAEVIATAAKDSTAYRRQLQGA